MNTFSSNRIAALLHYDWTMHKRKFLMTFIIIMSLYIICTFVTLVFNAELSGMSAKVTADLPKLLGDMCNTYFDFAGTVVWIVTTMLLTEKFCYPRTALSYLTLPGSSLEKFTVMVIDYVIAYFCVKVLFVVMFYTTLGIGCLFAPEMEWGRNVLDFISPDKIIDSALPEERRSNFPSAIMYEFREFISAVCWMSAFMTIANVAFHAVVCMFFKSNVQLKAILCETVFTVVLVILILGIVFGFLAYAKMNDVPKEEVKQFVMNLLFWCRYFIYIHPILAGLFTYIFYRQVCAKQAK